MQVINIYLPPKRNFYAHVITISGAVCKGTGSMPPLSQGICAYTPSLPHCQNKQVPDIDIILEDFFLFFFKFYV